MKKLLEIIPLLIGTCLLVEMTIEAFTYDPVTPVNVVNYNTVYNIKVIVPHETPEYTEAKFGNNAFLTHIERVGEMGTKSTYTGYCLYCQQQGMVTVEDDVAKEYEGRDEDFSAFLNEEATKICKCEASRAWWNVERRVRKAEARCLEVADSEYIGEVLKSSVRPIMKSEFDRLTIKDGGVTYSVYLDNDERIHVRREYKVTDDKTE